MEADGSGGGRRALMRNNGVPFDRENLLGCAVSMDNLSEEGALNGES